MLSSMQVLQGNLVSKMFFLFLYSDEQWKVASSYMMDLFVLNSHQSDGKRPEITRLPQSSGILQSGFIY